MCLKCQLMILHNMKNPSIQYCSQVVQTTQLTNWMLLISPHYVTKRLFLYGYFSVTQSATITAAERKQTTVGLHLETPLSPLSVTHMKHLTSQNFT